RIEVTPASVTIAAGETRQLTARAFASNNVEIPGVAFVWTTSNQNVVSVSGSGVATGVTEGKAEVIASAGGVISSPVSIVVLPPPIAGIGQVIINEALVAVDSGNTQARDFVELYNQTSGTLDISGLLVSFRQSGASNTVLTVSLPGAVGSRTSLIGPQGYFLIANGTQAYGTTADFDASSTNPPNGFNLNNTTGGIKLEIGGAKLDGLTYQGSSTAPPSIFLSFGEGAVLTFTGGTTNDLLRTPNGTDTNSNANDFRRNGTTASITPKRVNPTLP
nr:Ig-like domain-containing protein [Pyrinomonadaceae bacterium]